MKKLMFWESAWLSILSMKIVKVYEMKNVMYEVDK